MRCPHCGATVSEQSVICSSCGRTFGTPLTAYNSRIFINQISDNDESLSTTRRKGALLLAIPGVLFAFLCLVLLFFDIWHALQGASAVYFRYPIFATLPYAAPAKNRYLFDVVEMSELTFVFPFGSLSEIVLVSLWLFFSMCYGFWGLATLLGGRLRRKCCLILAVLFSICLFALRITLLTVQTSYLLTVPMYILCTTNMLGSIYLLRGEREVLSVTQPPWTRAKTLLLVGYGLFILLLLAAILLFRYSIIFP